MKRKCRIGISNMHCSNCSATVEKHFNSLENINVTVILSENEGVFTFDDAYWDERKIEKQLKSIGYPKKKNNSNKLELLRIIACVILTLPFLVNMILMMCNIHLDNYTKYIQFALATIIEILAGGVFIIGALRDFKNKRLGMDVLVSFGTLTAYIYSTILLFSDINNHLYFETCAMLLTIINIGKFVEAKAKVKTSNALKELMALQEKTANVLIDGKVVEKEISDVIVDDLIIIPTKTTIPLDGIVYQGSSFIDQSMLTGESLPVLINKGDNVLAGTLLQGDSIIIQVSKNVSESYLSKLISKVEEIQANKPRLQKIADKIASFFVPGVILISLITLLITYLITNAFDESLQRCMAVLMISCPCSLGLATPLSILVGSSRAIKLGIIYNNTEIFEKASKIDSICFDKTGTLTNGEFKVVDFISNNENALNIIYTMEANSNHPIAKSLVKYAKENNAIFLNELKVKEVIGKGVYADDYFIYKENTNVYLTYKEEIIATLKVKDTLKENTKEIINSFVDKNINVYIITGDNKDIAYEIANELSIPLANIYYEAKPEDKLKIIEDLHKHNKNICFVGDGINDSLALNKADLSVSMGSGSDVAKNSSDITLSNNQLNSLLYSINLSKKVYKNIIENFIWAFSYNIIAIPLACIGILNPLIAGICMAFSNISVVLNSLRLYKTNLKD